MSAPGDQSDDLCEAVRNSLERGESLRIVGSGSKAFLTGDGDFAAEPAPLLSLAEHTGVLDYRPEELVVTARAGTPLRELERQLAQAGQHLPFEPPRFHGGGTLGGAVACGLSGPGRPWRGSVRDAVLGVELINGRGERLRFGGQVMKNVAGYDVSRLQVGAFGTLGVLLAVSVKVLPQPLVESTRTFAVDAVEALTRCRDWARRPYPITGTCFLDGCLRVRLSGAEPAVAAAAAVLGGDGTEDAAFWDELRDHRLAFLTEPGLWRCAVPPAAPLPLDDCLIGWGGAERWWRPGATVDGAAAQGGHARAFDHGFGSRSGAPLPAVERGYAERVRLAFDPQRVFNPDLTRSAETADAD